MITTTIWEKPWEQRRYWWMADICGPEKNKCIAADRSKWIWRPTTFISVRTWDPLTSPPARAGLLHPHTSGFLQKLSKTTMLSWCQGVSLYHWWKRFYPFNCKIGGSIAISLHLGVPLTHPSVSGFRLSWERGAQHMWKKRHNFNVEFQPWSCQNWVNGPQFHAHKMLQKIIHNSVTC